MSKQKIIFYIETKLFDVIQQLSIVVYKSTLNNKIFNYDRYFNETYSENIKYIFPFDIIDDEIYKDILNGVLFDVFKMSKENAINYMVMDISNRKILFKYWVDNKKVIISKIIEIYKDFL